MAQSSAITKMSAAGNNVVIVDLESNVAVNCYPDAISSFMEIGETNIWAQPILKDFKRS